MDVSVDRFLAIRITRGETPGSTRCSFRMYQSPNYPTVVFSAAELRYWDPASTPRDPFFATLIHLKSEWEPVTILLSAPEGDISVADRKADWSRSLLKAHRECIADLRGTSAEEGKARGWWSTFIGLPLKDGVPASGLFVLPRRDLFCGVADFALLRPLPWNLPVLQSGEDGVTAAAHVGVHMATVNSSLRKADRLPPPHGAS